MTTQQQAGRVLYQAGIVAFHEVHEQLAYLQLEAQRPREPRADGSWIERVMLRPDQLEPIVSAGAVVVIEAIVQLAVPPEWIVSREEALTRLQSLAQTSARSEYGA